MAQLVFKVEGKPETISLDSFLTIIDNSFRALKDLDSAISSEPNGSLDWLITGLAVSSLAVAVKSKAKDPEKDYGEKVADWYLNGIETIRREEITPPYFSDNSLRLLQNVARTLKKNGADALAVVEPISRRAAELSIGIEKTISQLRGASYKSYGSVEGTLEMISIHRQPRFNIYHTISLRAVRCSLPDELMDKVVNALGRRVVASGLITYNAKDELTSVAVEELEVIAREDELPTIDEFIGSDRDFTGDMSTGEYIRSTRNG